jgi:hypothetical protein
MVLVFDCWAWRSVANQQPAQSRTLLMDSSQFPAVPADPVAQATPWPADEQAIGFAVQDLADRLSALEADAARRVEAMRTAFGELRQEVRDGRDDQPRRLVEFLGYKPTLSQQLDLFQALAAWHATNPTLTENRSAKYTTKKGAPVSFGWADLAQVMQVAQTAATFGLCAVTHTELDDTGAPIVTGYLIHISGGAIGGGPVPLYVDDESDRPGQAYAAGLTTARRLALQLVLGLAEARADDAAGNGPGASKTVFRSQAGSAAADPQRRRAEPPARPAGAGGDVQTSPKRPPPGWLSKEKRLALEEEMADFDIFPERLQEIKALLALHASSVRTSAASAGEGRP